MNELSSRQKQIINASINIISKKGIQNLTMKNLSREIGISEPAIYRHYASKQKILIAVLESFKHQNKLIDNNSTIEGESSFEFLKRTITMIINRLNNNPAMSAVIFSEETFQNESELSRMVIDIMNSTIEFITSLLGKCQKEGSIRSDIGKEDLSVIVMGSIRHIVTVWRLSGFSVDLNESGQKLIKTLEVLLTA